MSSFISVIFCICSCTNIKHKQTHNYYYRDCYLNYTTPSSYQNLHSMTTLSQHWQLFYSPSNFLIAHLYLSSCASVLMGPVSSPAFVSVTLCGLLQHLIFFAVCAKLQYCNRRPDLDKIFAAFSIGRYQQGMESSSSQIHFSEVHDSPGCLQI